MKPLENKIALITGAGAGIGHEICKCLAAEGTTIIAVARNKNNLQSLQQQTGEGNHQYWPIDLSIKEGHDELLEKLTAFSFPHIVVVNLNIASARQIVKKMDEKTFSQNFTENIDHIFSIINPSLSFQKNEGYGRWIGISSIASHTGIPGQAVYNARKAAMESLFKNIAVEEGRNGITSNIVEAGIIATPTIHTKISDEHFAAISKCNVMKRAGTPLEVASAVGFLASPGASYITGATIPVNGGIYLAWNFLP